jgi:peptidyl-prolyl cis-trans isomerase D
MISWMQKHNKFLIVTIWIATISFIFTGATYGFSFGLRSNSIGEVGDIKLSKDRFQMEYRSLYNRYNQMFQGKFDEEQAKQMGLQDQVLNNMAAEAKILNLAKEFGIVVSDQEVAQKIATIPAFQKENKFERTIYNNYLKNSGLTTKTFEASLRDSIAIQKTFALLNNKGLENEYKAITTAFEIADKLNYLILSEDDINSTIDEAKLKDFWEVRKEQFQTTKQYAFDLVWVETDDVNVTEEEIKDFYQKHSFEYRDKEDKHLSLEEAKDQIIKDLKIQKSKKNANKQYIAFKKGKIDKDERLTYDVNDFRLPKTFWDALKDKERGSIIKPKVVNNRYVIAKIVDIIQPKIKDFKEAKSEVLPLYKSELFKEKMANLSQTKLTNIDKEKTKISDFITLKNNSQQNLGLKEQEMANFTSKLFTSNQEKGIIPIGKKVIVYKIVDQKLITIDKNATESLKQNADQIKSQDLESNLMELLDKKYPTKFYK